MKSYLLLILIGIFAPYLSSSVQAQTCRVSAGLNADGVPCFVEVFEYDYVDQKPEFPGGGTSLLKFINNNRRYPARAYDLGIQGRVMCEFVVTADGTVQYVSVLKGVEPSLNKEAVRIISTMPKWTPGRLDGTNVPVRVVCAVPFRR